MKIFFSSLVLTLILLNHIYSQNFQFGIGGGYSYLDGDTYFTQEPTESPFNHQLGLSDCYNISIRIKYITSELPLKIRGGFDFISGSSNFNYVGIRSPINSFFSDMHLDANQNLYSLSVAIETPIIKSIVTPYLSFGALINIFGETDVNITPEPDPHFTHEFRYNNSLRAGISTGFGFEYEIYTLVIDASLNYNFMNLLGKGDVASEIKEENFNILNLSFIVYYNL